jgi:branched-subunit amino acid aminotransferase/4-amino-4-deoxychorismate lyase
VTGTPRRRYDVVVTDRARLSAQPVLNPTATITTDVSSFAALVGGRWLTPSVARCGIAGVARGWLLANIPGAAVAELSAAEVSHAEALVLCNSVRGILPVRRLGMREWQRDDVVAPLRARLAEAQPAFA